MSEVAGSEPAELLGSRGVVGNTVGEANKNLSNLKSLSNILRLDKLLRKN